MPQVSIIVSAFNAEKYLNAALRSVLVNYLGKLDFELVLVDDCSTDKTRSIAEAFAKRYACVKVIGNETNMGLAASLNRAISATDSEFIGRLDADDIDLPGRVIRALAELKQRPDLVICGAARYSFRDTYEVIRYHTPHALSSNVLWRCLWGVPFAHPTVLFRRQAVDKLESVYDPNVYAVEDFELWGRMLDVGGGENLLAPGILYRVHPAQATKKRQELRLRDHRNIASRELTRKLGIQVSAECLMMQQACFLNEGPENIRLVDMDIRSAVEFRELVCAQLKNLFPDQNWMVVGFGLDLIRFRLIARKFGLGNWIMGSRFRRRCISGALPIAAKFWRATRIYNTHRSISDAQSFLRELIDSGDAQSAQGA